VGKKITTHVPVAGVEPRCIAVVGGDRACMRATAYVWTGRAAGELFKNAGSVVRLPNPASDQELVFVLDSEEQLCPWPGGPLVWLYPERGPSEPELAQMRRAWANSRDGNRKFQILICLPAEVAHETAAHDLDILDRTLRWATDPGIEFELRGLWP